MITKKELLKKDLQHINVSAAIQSTAYLRTIIEMQIFIISNLTKKPQEDVAKKVNEDIKNNISFVCEKIKNNIDDADIFSKWNN